MQLQQQHKQKQIPSQKIFQMLSVMQMDSQELIEYIKKSVEENPTLDMDFLYDSMREHDKLLNKVSNKNNVEFKKERDKSDSENDWQIDAAAANQGKNSIKRHLLFQLLGLRLGKEEELLCTYLIDFVDKKGFLQETAESISAIGIERQLAERCLSILRDLEPKGVCAYSLQDCLIKQLGESEEEKNAAIIVKQHLTDLAKGHYSHISRTTGISLEDVKKAGKLISRLSPIPAAGFDCVDEVQYVKPDIVVEIDNGEVICDLFVSYVPILKFDPYYSELLRSTDDEAVRDYLCEKQYRAKQLIQNIQQREDSLLSCARRIVEIQKGFFLKKESLKPLTMEVLARQIGVNKSTISRILRGKYIQCSWGVMQMSELLSKKVSRKEGDYDSIDQAKAMIIKIYAEEDKNNPLSDEQVSLLLSQHSISVSRRCVAKYREQLGIPNADIRMQKTI